MQVEYLILSLYCMTLKQKIYNHYQQALHDKITMLQQVLADLKESGANETKSTAGDKHETSLAMLQIEQANTRGQLQEMLNQQAAFKKIDPEVVAPLIMNGSLIKTDKGYFFMSVALGKAVVDDVSVIALSPQSPLGQKLIGLQTNNTATINNTTYLINGIE